MKRVEARIEPARLVEVNEHFTAIGLHRFEVRKFIMVYSIEETQTHGLHRLEPVRARLG